MPANTHINYLDTIRGLAALTVISDHYVIAYGLPCTGPFCTQWLDFSPLHIWWDGAAAVSMFFVLSGLVLSIKYFRDGHRPNLSHFRLGQFLIGRMFRIWLPYLIVLSISIGLFRWTYASTPLPTSLPPSDWITRMWHAYPLTAVDMLKESFLLHMPSLIVLLPQAWTLSIELVISLLLPVGLLLAERGTQWLLLFSLLATTLLGVSPFLWHFLAGLLIARHYTVIASHLASHSWQRRATLLLGLALYTINSVVSSQTVGDITLQLTSGLGSSLLLMFALSSRRTQRLLSIPLLRQIGKVSYSAYLIHMAALICVTPYILLALQQFTDQRWLQWLGGWLLSIILIQGLSLLFYHALETPSMALGRKVSRYLPKN